MQYLIHHFQCALNEEISEKNAIKLILVCKLIHNSLSFVFQVHVTFLLHQVFVKRDFCKIREEIM